jgi:hypothetical protein
MFGSTSFVPLSGIALMTLGGSANREIETKRTIQVIKEARMSTLRLLPKGIHHGDTEHMENY